MGYLSKDVLPFSVAGQSQNFLKKRIINPNSSLNELPRTKKNCFDLQFVSFKTE